MFYWTDALIIGVMIVILVVLATLVGCGTAQPPCQTAGEMRCNGNQVEMCDGEGWNHRWTCESCVEVPEGATCE